MDWQQTVSLGIVAIAAGLLTRGWLRARRLKRFGACDCIHGAKAGGCGSPGGVVVSGKKGQPQIITRRA